ncbi:MAG: hypothetical protein Q7T55_15655 [Solirubrobacteraceae bacterium]|nr:hypothetical protein [Solirubrobacteraceae bacterium]
MAVFRSRAYQVCAALALVVGYYVWEETENGAPLSLGLVVFVLIAALMWFAIESAIHRTASRWTRSRRGR